MLNFVKRAWNEWRLMRETKRRADDLASDPGLSALSHRASDRFLRSLEQAEEDCGRHYADQIAEAHVDAGSRFLDGERAELFADEAGYMATLPTAKTIQNQI